MEKLTKDSPETRSLDVVAENIAQLKALFPEATTEGRIDFEVLKQLLGGELEDREEKFGLSWHGKRQARHLALTPSTGTLRPSRDESLNWDTTKNLIIEGDNLEVLKILQKSFSNEIKLIYIDPPYNTGHDFVYEDDFQDGIKNYLITTCQIDEVGNMKSSNSEASGRFHTAWLNMMYPRLKLARNLLSEDGAIFISIDDTELAHLKLIMSEIFGEENFQADISWQKRYTRSNNTIDFTTMVEHIIVYSKSENFVVNLLDRTQEADARYSNPDNDPRGPWKGASFLNPATPQQRPNLCYPIKNPNTGNITNPTSNAWRRSIEEFERLGMDNRLYWGIDGKQPVPSIKMFLSEARNITPVNFWDHAFAGNTDDGTKDLKELFEEKIFDNPKPIQLVKRILEHGSNKESIILDFFAGSGTTGQAVLEQNVIDGGSRRFILVQLPEPLNFDNKEQHTAATFCKRIGKPGYITEITKERLRRSILKIKENTPLFSGDTGFRVLKLDSSNIKSWEPNLDNISATIFDSIDHIKIDRTEDDLVHEVLLKRGIDPCIPIESRNIADKIVYSIGYGVLIVCVSPSVCLEDVESLAHGISDWAKNLAPAGGTTCVFRDSSFIDDVVKSNLIAILEQGGIQNIRSL